MLGSLGSQPEYQKKAAAFTPPARHRRELPVAADVSHLAAWFRSLVVGRTLGEPTTQYLANRWHDLVLHIWGFPIILGVLFFRVHLPAPLKAKAHVATNCPAKTMPGRALPRLGRWYRHVGTAIPSHSVHQSCGPSCSASCCLIIIRT